MPHVDYFAVTEARRLLDKAVTFAQFSEGLEGLDEAVAAQIRYTEVLDRLYPVTD